MLAQDDQTKSQAKALRTSAYSSLLANYGIEPTKEGLLNYLTSLKTDDALRERAKTLISQLSAEDYLVREKSTRMLKSLSGITVTLIESVKDEVNTTTEGRYRLKAIIAAKIEQNSAQIQFAVLRQIAASKIEGLTPALISVSSQLEKQSFVMRAFEDAIPATSSTDDIELLKENFRNSSPNSSLKTGCLKALVQVAPAVALKFAKENKEKTKGRFGLEIAKILLENKRSEAFDVLIELIRDKDSKTRITALNVIRSSSGLKLAGNYLQDEKSINAAVDESTVWLKNSDPKTIQYVWEIAQVRLGRRLISHYDKNVVVELDESDNITWSASAKKPFTCFGMANGHRLIVEYQAGSIIEYDAEGKEVRRLKNVSKSMSGICVRENGNLIMAAGQNDNQVFEVNPNGDKIETFTVPGTPTSVEIALNGNLVCALYKKNEIVEIDANGKIASSFKVEGAPYHAQPLKNGNYLVAFAKDKKIAEVDSAGNEIWKHDCATGSYRAQELEDGTIVFADSEGTHHITRSGEEVKFTDLSVSGKIHYMHSY